MKLLDISTRKFPNTFAMVDDEDFEELARRKWCPNFCKHTNKTYVVRTLSAGESSIKKVVKLHRFLLGFPIGVQVDHIDGNTLNNQRKNLRTCTPSQNMSNRARSDNRSSSLYKGVGKRRGMFCCLISIEGRQVWVGQSESEETVAAMYNKAAIRYYGEFAVLNIIDRPGTFVRAPDLSVEELKMVTESGYLQHTTAAEAVGG